MTRLVGTWKLPPQMAGGNPLRVPGVRIRSTPAGLEVLLSRDTTAVGPASSWSVTATLGCQLWGSPGVLYLDPAYAYMTFARPSNAQLYAIEQSAWPAFAAGTDALPLAWVDRHDALTPRLSFARAALALALLSGNANLAHPSDAPTDLYFHQFGTDTAPNMTYFEPDGSNPARTTISGTPAYVKNYAYSDLPPTSTWGQLPIGVARNRIAANGSGVTLAISDSGALWHIVGSTYTAVTIANPSGISGINYHHAIAVSYNRTTRQWHLLYESLKYDTAFGLDVTTILDRAVHTLLYDESVHGVINPASGSNWVIDRTLQTDIYTQPGCTTTPFWQFLDNHGGTALDGVVNAITNPSGPFNYFDGSSVITAPINQVLDFTSLLTAGTVVTFDITGDGAGTLSINGGGTVVAVVTLTPSSGRIRGDVADPTIHSVSNRPDVPDGAGTGLYWVYGSSTSAPTFVYVPWLILSGSSVTLVNQSTLQDNFDWYEYTTTTTAQFPAGAKGFCTWSPFGFFPFVQGRAFRTDDILAQTATLPPCLQHATYKYWSNVSYGVSAVDWHQGLGTPSGCGYRTFIWHYHGADHIDWQVNELAYPASQQPPTDGGIGDTIGPGLSSRTIYSEPTNGLWFGIGEDGSVIGYPQSDNSIVKYFGPGGDHTIADAALRLDPGVPFANLCVYKPFDFGTGTTAPFIDAVGNIIDNTGALDASHVFRAVTWDGSTGLYAIVGNDLMHRAGAFGTSWTTTHAAMSTETTILLLRYMEDTTILLVEGTSGTVRAAVWDGVSVTTPITGVAFDTDDSFIRSISTPSFNPFSAFSIACVT